ncbi:PIF1-like helicase [Hirsutella rhossiliensis]|uniref:ATP-dependent DNA helicase n=1 Tax=Hirsutella rhossiliensis TaxID=111463 RepID=A0A9P8SHE7_9HYPO|nr:PIF1-like helicase domain-containing protein [Hirsutella rhossiliensis]KAH0962089.1 PIF1-like helicase domain-containing protein [Hirsutella rhossiliensis]
MDDGAAGLADAEPSGQRQPRRREKRARLRSRDERPTKQVRSGIGRQRRRELQAEDLASVLGFLEEDFAIKERLSNDQTWCTPISLERKVSTVRDFYRVFHDASTLPIRTCMLCYRKRRPLTILMPELLSRGRVRHMFPDELKGLTPVEEKLVSLNSCYGHVKGHITVFPNNVQELATKVLPHPLLQALDEIHVSWQGAEKPAPSDLSSLLSVRRRVVERALVWLKRNNPHYAEIEIDAAEMESWGDPIDGVPSSVYDRMERNEPSAWEKARTAHVVPPTERAMDDEGSVEIEELFALLNHGQEAGGQGEGHGPNGEDVADVEKLRFACDAVGEGADDGRAGPRAWVGSSAGGVRARGDDGCEPYIRVSRGAEFANSFEASFFARTFPTLFPFGVGGPRAVEAEAAAGELVSSRSLNLRMWADIVLRRHGGRFALHHIFAFLVFNMGVRSRNRRVSMLSVARKNFRKVERMVRSMTAERLGAARVELESSGKTTDGGVKELLRSLSLYGHQQPMSREVRLNMRRKIQSLIVGYGVPAIWFTINPNDITNPVKLRLAAYRTRDPDAAEEFLEGLGNAYKRARLAISDPMSSAVFFHREMKLFFDHYVKVGEESVFGRISKYYGAVETNERGALHVHGLLWLQGNAHLSSMLADIHGEDQAAYRERIIQYVDSVFSEDLDQEGFRAVQAERSVTSDIGSLLDNTEQFSDAFDEEANFCAGATQVHTHSPTCVKYSLGKGARKGNLCRFKSPWRLVDKTAITADGVLQIRRTHSMVNRWNKAIAVGLRHNHDISFIATQRKAMALMYYVTNYATKVEDPVWKRVAAAADLLAASTGDGTANGGQDDGGGAVGDDAAKGNRTRQFLMRVANRVFTERPLSQVEVIAHLLGYPAEFTNSSAWAYLNTSLLYWEVFRRWPYLRRANGAAAIDDALNESVLRRPGKHATVCLDGYLSKDFGHNDDEESCHRRAAVQHLALFVPWESFLCEETGEINSIWERAREALAPRISCLVDNVQLLRRSAEDAKRDAKQWAASSGDGDSTVAHVEEGETGEAGAEFAATYRSNNIGDATRLIDVVRGAVGTNQVTAKSPELMAMMRQLCRFQQSALCSTAELEAIAIPEQGLRCISMPGRVFSGAALPPQDQVKAIKSQQISASRERERMIQGGDAGQLCQFVGGEGGTGKSRIIGALVELFSGKSLSNRLLITATSGTAAAQINGITIHSACGFTKDRGAGGANTAKDLDGVRLAKRAERFIHGQSRMDWQEKDVLVIDEVSMLGARTLHAINERLCRLRGSQKDFGGIPIVLFCGDFQQFRPVQERSIVLPSAAISWDVDNSFKAEQRHQHDKAHALWKRFTTVVMLNEQMRAAGDPELQGLLKRIRQGVQDRTDLDLLNSRCYREGRRIPWETGITVVTPLNRNRWNLNMEASLAFRVQQRSTMRIFISEHKWKEGLPTEEEAIMGLKLVNGAGYSAVEVIVDKASPGHRISSDMTIHFGPPAGILLESATTKDLHFNDVSRKGLPCAAAFACTDYKVQGRTPERVALELRGHGRRKSMEGPCLAMRPVQLICAAIALSNARRHHARVQGAERDLVGNRVPEEMTAAQARLEVLSERTVEEALRRSDGDAEESRRVVRVR